MSSSSESLSSSFSSIEESSSELFLTNAAIDRYKEAGAITSKILKSVSDRCQAGVSVREICAAGDKAILAETDKISGDFRKGVAFPTCLNVNNCICHFSPAKNDHDRTLKCGDVVKVELGAHVDGYMAIAGKTIVIGDASGTKEKITGRKADVILAAYWALKAALHLTRIGKSNYDITEMIQRVAGAYNCVPVEGIRSFQLKQHILNADKFIVQNPSESLLKDYDEEFFGNYEVYALDILISTGKGSGHEKNDKVSLYKKTDEESTLKLTASRTFYSEVDSRFGIMPFNIRQFEDEKKARLGVVECMKRSVIESFPILYEKSGEFVAQFKHTVIILPSGLEILTDYPVNLDDFVSEYSITDEEINQILNLPLKTVPSVINVKTIQNDIDPVAPINLDDIENKTSEDKNAVEDKVKENFKKLTKAKCVEARVIDPFRKEPNKADPNLTELNFDGANIAKALEIKKGKVFKQVQKAMCEFSAESDVGLDEKLAQKIKEELDLKKRSDC